MHQEYIRATWNPATPPTRLYQRLGFKAPGVRAVPRSPPMVPMLRGAR
jgi:hypothetical protein